MNKIRLTVTLEPSVIEHLPARNRSAAINSILKEHVQKERANDLYKYLKKRLLDDPDLDVSPKDEVKAYAASEIPEGAATRWEPGKGWVLL